MLLKPVQSQKIDPKKLTTQHFTFNQILEAYDTLGHAANIQALGARVPMIRTRRADNVRTRMASCAAALYAQARRAAADLGMLAG